MPKRATQLTIPLHPKEAHMSTFAVDLTRPGAELLRPLPAGCLAVEQVR